MCGADLGEGTFWANNIKAQSHAQRQHSVKRAMFASPTFSERAVQTLSVSSPHHAPSARLVWLSYVVPGS